MNFVTFLRDKTLDALGNTGDSQKKADKGRKMNQVESKLRCKACNGPLQLERA
jgi:hypothetical protein